MSPGGHIYGLDLGVVLELAQQMGYDTAAISMLYPGIEAGLMDAASEEDGGSP